MRPVPRRRLAVRRGAVYRVQNDLGRGPDADLPVAHPPIQLCAGLDHHAARVFGGQHPCVLLDRQQEINAPLGHFVSGLRRGDVRRAHAQHQRAVCAAQLVDPTAQMRGRDGCVGQIDQRRVQRIIFNDLGRGCFTGAHYFDAQSPGTTVQLFDAHKDTHRLRLQQNPVCNPFGQGFQQVQPLIRQFERDGFGHAIIAQNPVHIVVDRTGQRLDLDNDIESNALCDTPFGLKRANFDLDRVIAHGNPVHVVVL